MIGGLALSFGAPLVLFGLLALPAIWWLLKLTPPRPQMEPFPPLRILERVLKREETPSKSPWWLTLLRLLLAALIIFALAAPTLNPREGQLTGTGPLALLVDNGWASGGDFDVRRTAAEGLIREAGEAGRPVSLAFTAEGQSDDATPVEANAALERLAAAAPRPIPTDRAAAAERIATALAGNHIGSLAFVADGLDAEGTDAASRSLAALTPSQAIVYAPDVGGLVGLTGADNSTEALVVQAVRPGAAAETRSFAVRAIDAQEREIGRTSLDFAAGSASAEARFAIPVELRNDIARLEVDGAETAGAVRLVDDSFRRRRVALVSGESSDLAQPLLSPLYYITRALEPFADLVRPQSANLSESIPALIARRPSVIVLADIGILPDNAREALQGFVEDGGYLLRFAGPRLAAAPGDDTLVPVRLRTGERQLGGAMSWSEPQKIAPMPDDEPFAGIAVPEDVTVTRQILAEPAADLSERTWASLADGTPLVTAETVGAGTIVLFHVTAEATWSNLPISGAFVEMLRRIVTLSRAGAGPSEGRTAADSLPPYRVLDGQGRLTSPGADVQPLQPVADGDQPVTRENPPGLYGSEEGYLAHNLLPADAELLPLPALDLGAPVEARGYGGENSVDLAPWLFAAALVLFALDALALLWLNGAATRIGSSFSRGRAGALPAILAIAAIGLIATVPDARAQEPAPTPSTEQVADHDVDVERAIRATETTHLAYVLTGDEATDEISRQGLAGLSQFITAKTALEPGEPMGVDIAADELAFFPIIYWPIDASAPMPSETAIGRMDAYMKQGGTVLFDVADDPISGLSSGNVSAGQRRLREILADLDVPPLDPVPTDHVLTKAFYMLDDFPGRHTGSQLWVESLVRDSEGGARPARGGDGVSSIMITSNDFASAWAVDSQGLFLFPTDSADPAQREYAYRAGVNIVMYVLTGNYKADQVHVPALLERLGQ
ncbi:conserved hypothetical membrane protein [Aurantimonas manganoxydans SI85-9A1]|uniref:Conserved hypothetical membrane protein n=1 Tax=Aurantimonas manganoxydans (strain ATCC BAA-1229 / DSM 21871 / SI85-9A1) TaxID=287752 RepID=Q1YLV3_AURMS|nr:DUF4159 domain-containing protein [Aurantimonas manganoxydans]EAS51628.1 conserved hypothetical membrane protein [Aurantimonas manganoxydans SI85-9A1]